MKYVIKNVKILNGHKDMNIVLGKAIVVEDGKIKDICDENMAPTDIESIDLGGKYLLPGLINLHVHLPSSGRPTSKKLDYEKVAKLLFFSLMRNTIHGIGLSNAKKQLLSGTTTIRTVGGVLDCDTKLRDRINKGKAVGPRILASNCAISVEGGHMTGSVAKAVHSPKEAVEMVRDLDKQKPDLIKLMITGGVLDCEVPGEPGILKMPAEYVKAAVDEAHKLGYKVAAHVEGTKGMQVALENGVDTLEHGGHVNDHIINLLKKTGKAVVATISPVIPYVVMDESITHLPELDRTNGKALFEYFKECYKACLDNDIPLGLGTDTGCQYITHYDMWRELAYFCKYCDVSPSFAIYSATLGNAKIAEIDDITGSVDVGKSADFMVVDNNPLEDIRALRKASEVYFRGKRYQSPKVKKMPFVEVELDKILDE